MKILFVSSLYGTEEISGAQKVVEVLAEGMARRGHEAVVVSLSLDGAEPTSTGSGVAVHRLRLRNIYSPWPPAPHGFASRAAWHTLDLISPTMVRRVGAVLDRERPDVVHSHLLAGLTLAPWIAAKRRRLPLVHTMHDWYLRCINSAMYRRGRLCERPCRSCRIYREPHRRASRSVDIPVGVTDFILERHLEAGFFEGARATAAIHNSYDGVIGKARVRGSDDPLRLGFLGALSPAKGVDAFLKAFRDIERDGCEVLVGGTGAADFEAALRARHAGPGVTFLGRVQPIELFRQIDALVVPSQWHEPGCPTVILEAYGHGVPVIASRRGGNPEVVWEDETGYVFDPDRPGELARLISRLIDDPSPLGAMQDACLARVQDFATDRMINSYLGVYAEAAGAPR